MSGPPCLSYRVSALHQRSIQVMSGAQSTPRSRTRSTSSPTAASEPRKHTSKACERCRNRRIKCIGGIPCSACTKADCTADCQVRSVPRPKRCVKNCESSFPSRLTTEDTYLVPHMRWKSNWRALLPWLSPSQSRYTLCRQIHYLSTMPTSCLTRGLSLRHSLSQSICQYQSRRTP